MKAVIVELKGHDAAALTDDGCILKVKNKKYAIGQVIELNAARKSKKFVVWAASAAAAVILLGAGAWAYYTPYSYVSLDVNPSIEYSVNRFDRVLSADAVNNDGIEILQKLSLKNKTIDKAVKETVDEIAQKGYFEGTDPGGIVISTAGPNESDAQQLAQDLQTAAEEETKDAETPVEVEAISVGLARVQEARTLGTTPGKLNLVQKLQASSDTPDSIKVEDWLNKPVKEIMKAIKQNKKDDKAADTSDGQDTSSSQSGESSQAASSTAESETASSAAQAKQNAAKQNGKAAANSPAAANSSSASSKVTGKPGSSFSETAVSSSESTEPKVTGKPDSSSSESEESKLAGKSVTAGTNQNETGKSSTNNGNGKSK